MATCLQSGRLHLVLTNSKRFYVLHFTILGTVKNSKSGCSEASLPLHYSFSPAAFPVLEDLLLTSSLLEVNVWGRKCHLTETTER